MDQVARPKVHSNNIVSSILFGLIVVFAAVAVVFVYEAGKYYDVMDRVSNIDAAEAQKVGNWELLDSDLIIKKHENISIDGRNVAMVEIKDKKNNNRMIILETKFSSDEMLNVKGEVLNQILAHYSFDGYYFKGSDKAGKLGQEIVYNFVGWKSVSGDTTGIIGNLDCPAGEGNTESIFIVSQNIVAKYDNLRVLQFIDTLKCADVQINGGNDSGSKDKADTDSDWLPDVVEKMMGVDPYDSDSDDDGYKDGDEAASGHNPLRPRQWGDQYEPKDFDKVKKDIKFLSPDTYTKLFGG